MVRSHKRPEEADDARTMYRPATIAGSLVALAAVGGLFFTGDVQGKLMFVQQPMKMASAESLCHTETDPDFSILTVGTHNNCDSVTHVIEVPYVLPFLAEGKFSGVTLQGVKDLKQHYQEKFGPGDYRPNLFVTYWAFRAMIGLMLVPVAFALLGTVADAPWADSGPALVRLVRPDHHSDTVPRQLGWLGVHRNGQTAMGCRAEPDRRPDGAADSAAGRVRPRGGDGAVLARGVHPPVRRARGDLVLVDAPLRGRRTTGARLRTRPARAARATTWPRCPSPTERT